MMTSILERRSTPIWFCFAMVVSAVLDVASTLLAFERMGGTQGEANPIFGAVGGHEGGGVSPVFILISIKVVSTILATLWIRGVVRRIPALYPKTEGEFGFFRFANNLFYGKDVPWWTALFGIPPFSRIICAYSVPVVAVIVVGGVAASITNTFGLISNYVGVVVFWLVTVGFGCLLGIVFLHRDYLRISEDSVVQQCESPAS